MRIRRVVLRFAVLPLIATVPSACASAGTAFVPSPAQVPALEARVQSNPTDGRALTQLGAAYQRDGRLGEAAALLERARVAAPDDGTVAFVLGTIYRDQERFDAATTELQRALDLGPSGAARRRIESQLALVRRGQLRATVREALAIEASLDAQPALARVAVFPFEFAGADEQLRPLGRALGAMLATDLSQTDRLTVVERERIQALLDEVALGQTVAIDPNTAARGGRLLGAGRVVQGQVSGGEAALRLDAAVVEVGRGDDPGLVSREDALARLFDMEKELAFAIYEEMGIALTPAERERVSQRPTENLQAILAYGQGLEAEAAGRYAEAQQFFQQAASIDSGFEEARVRSEQTAVLSDAAAVDLALQIDEIALSQLTAEIEAQVDALSREAQGAVARDPAQEALGTEGVGGGDRGPTSLPTPIIIRLPKPGGGS